MPVWVCTSRKIISRMSHVMGGCNRPMSAPVGAAERTVLITGWWSVAIAQLVSHTLWAIHGGCLLVPNGEGEQGGLGIGVCMGRKPAGLYQLIARDLRRGPLGRDLFPLRPRPPRHSLDHRRNPWILAAVRRIEVSLADVWQAGPKRGSDRFTAALSGPSAALGPGRGEPSRPQWIRCSGSARRKCQHDGELLAGLAVAGVEDHVLWVGVDADQPGDLARHPVASRVSRIAELPLFRRNHRPSQVPNAVVRRLRVTLRVCPAEHAELCGPCTMQILAPERAQIPPIILNSGGAALRACGAGMSTSPMVVAGFRSA